jgi:hypothetical protein
MTFSLIKLKILIRFSILFSQDLIPNKARPHDDYCDSTHIVAMPHTNLGKRACSEGLCDGVDDNTMKITQYNLIETLLRDNSSYRAAAKTQLEEMSKMTRLHEAALQERDDAANSLLGSALRRVAAETADERITAAHAAREINNTMVESLAAREKTMYDNVKKYSDEKQKKYDNHMLYLTSRENKIKMFEKRVKNCAVQLQNTIAWQRSSGTDSTSPANPSLATVASEMGMKTVDRHSYAFAVNPSARSKDSYSSAINNKTASTSSPDAAVEAIQQRAVGLACDLEKSFTSNRLLREVNEDLVRRLENKPIFCDACADLTEVQYEPVSDSGKQVERSWFTKMPNEGYLCFLKQAEFANRALKTED